MRTTTLSTCGADLDRANALMIEALALLDRHQSDAAAYLDHAIVKLGIRPASEGLPPTRS